MVTVYNNYNSKYYCDWQLQLAIFYVVRDKCDCDWQLQNEEDGWYLRNDEEETRETSGEEGIDVNDLLDLTDIVADIHHVEHGLYEHDEDKK